MLAKLLAGGKRHHLHVVVLGEYRFGLLCSRYRRRIGEWVKELEREFIVLELDAETIRHYANVREQLRRDENRLLTATFGFRHSLFSITSPS